MPIRLQFNRIVSKFTGVLIALSNFVALLLTESVVGIQA